MADTSLSAFCIQALSINVSLSRAKSAAENGESNCRELRDSAVRVIREAGGEIDYAEVRLATYFS